MALKNLLLSQGAKPDKVAFLENYRSGIRGVSLEQVGQLAEQAKLSHEIVFRETGQPVPVPSIVHWKVSHFAAIVEREAISFISRTRRSAAICGSAARRLNLNRAAISSYRSSGTHPHGVR